LAGVSVGGIVALVLPLLLLDCVVLAGDSAGGIVALSLPLLPPIHLNFVSTATTGCAVRPDTL
jgi:hypothetical protein